MSELKIDNFLEPLYNPDERGICIYLANTLDLISTKYHSQAQVVRLADAHSPGAIGNLGGL